MIFGSVCSGISSASVAWKPLGWTPRFFADIDPFASSVLAHHYPEVPNLGDFTGIGADAGPIDLLVGGTPCQSFSVTGKRGGLSDPRGALSVKFCDLAYSLESPWVLWENVPGVLTRGGGADFASILSRLVGSDIKPPGEGWRNSGVVVGGSGCYSASWCVLDARYHGVPQRRRRVFLLGYRGDWRYPASVLLEPPGDQWHRTAMLCQEQEVSHTLRAEGFDASEDGTGRGRPIVHSPSGPRYATPTECERLQGFPDGYTLVPWRRRLASDGARYRAIGNSASVPVVRMIGRRIDLLNRGSD